MRCLHCSVLEHHLDALGVVVGTARLAVAAQYRLPPALPAHQIRAPSAVLASRVDRDLQCSAVLVGGREIDPGSRSVSRRSRFVTASTTCAQRAGARRRRTARHGARVRGRLAAANPIAPQRRAVLPRRVERTGAHQRFENAAVDLLQVDAAQIEQARERPTRVRRSRSPRLRLDPRL